VSKKHKREKRKRQKHASLAEAHAFYAEPEDLRQSRESPVIEPARGPTPEQRAGNIAVFDSFSGIAGDMTIAALVDAGAPLELIFAGLSKLALPPFALAVEPVMRGGLRALHLSVTIAEERTYQPMEMRELIRGGALPDRVERRALAVIDALELGEARAHDTDQPHFHEAGGVDAIVDIVGSMLALELLDVDECYCPVVTVGAGTIVKAEHGPIPAAPGPAAAHILQSAGFPLRFVEASHELVTPTGAAILAAVAKPRAVVVTATCHGAGAGTFDPQTRPNALRIFIGTSPHDGFGAETRSISELAANIDDMTAELLAYARDRLLEAGAFDAWLEPIGMKKGRAATKLCALVPEGDEDRFASIFLRETTTLGVRTTAWRRYEAKRWQETFTSSLGEVRIKWRDWQGERRGAPEFEDVKALALRHNLPALEVQRTIERELG
jgi:uncharacterized protein (TIGR00299 family) protein